MTDFGKRFGALLSDADRVAALTRRKWPEGTDPRMQPHVLVITSTDDGSLDWEVEHPDACPSVCHWAPPVDGKPWFTKYADDRDPADLHYPDERAGYRDCLLAWQVSNMGIDLLDFGEHAEFADPDHVPVSPFEAPWHRLRPGRYLIEAWYTPGGWAGDYYDADEGLTLIGAAP